MKTIESVKGKVSELGFEKSYNLLDEEVVIGEAFVKNGWTLVFKTKEVTLINRWTGELMVKELFNQNTFNNIKRSIN